MVSPEGRTALIHGGHFRTKEVRQCPIQMARSIHPERAGEHTGYIKAIEIPSLLIWGREDRTVRLEIGQRLARELKRSSFKMIGRCGHILQEERPGEVIAAIKHFETGLGSGYADGSGS